MPPSYDPINELDTTMVELAKAGNEEAFTLLFQRYSRGVYGYIVGLVGNDDEANDITQATFFKVWQKIHTLSDNTSFKPWLYTIARNIAFDAGRKKRRSSNQSWEDLAEYTDVLSNQSFEEALADNEIIHRALALLPAKLRDCLLLQIQGGFSNSEIANMLNLSKESVTTYICTARKQFRQVYYQIIREQNILEGRRSE